MTFQTERDAFFLDVAAIMLDQKYDRHVIKTTVTRLLRHAQTLHRLAVAQCNGDWPTAYAVTNKERDVDVCRRCDSEWHASTLRKGPEGFLICPDCRTQDAVRALLAGTPFSPVFGGDPRGCVLQLAPVGAKRDDIDAGRVRLLAVPVRVRS